MPGSIRATPLAIRQEVPSSPNCCFLHLYLLGIPFCLMALDRFFEISPVGGRLVDDVIRQQRPQVKRSKMMEQRRGFSRPIVDLLRERIADSLFSEGHALQAYIRAFEGSDKRAVGFVGVGRNSVVMELENGDILKISSRVLTESMGTRPFEVPILERCVVDVGHDLKVYWFVQPRAQTPVTWPQYKLFRSDLEKNKYFLELGGDRQLGLHEERVKLLDPYAVRIFD